MQDSILTHLCTRFSFKRPHNTNFCGPRTANSSREDSFPRQLFFLPPLRPLPPPLPPPMASTLPFHSLARLLDSLEALPPSSHLPTLSQWLHTQPAHSFSSGTLPLFRLLLPLEAARTYSLAEQRLASLVTSALGLSHRSTDAERLKEWRGANAAGGTTEPTEGREGAGGGGRRTRREEGNLSLVVRAVLAARVPERAGGISGRPLTLRELDLALDELAAVGPAVHRQCAPRAAGGVSGARKGWEDRSPALPILRTLLSRCSPLEAKWLVRIILRDMQLLSRWAVPSPPRCKPTKPGQRARPARPLSGAAMRASSGRAR